MWSCPDCERVFASANQSHMCTDTTIDDLFEQKPVDLLLAFDKVLISVIDWEPCSVGTSTKSVVFSKRKAWLIVKPMSKELDLKIYTPDKLHHPSIKKSVTYPNKYAHHLRISSPDDVTADLLALLRKGYDAYD